MDMGDYYASAPVTVLSRGSRYTIFCANFFPVQLSDSRVSQWNKYARCSSCFINLMTGILVSLEYIRCLAMIPSTLLFAATV